MSRTNNDDADVKGSQIVTVRVSFEDLKQVIQKRQESHNREEVVLRISPTWKGFDDVETVTIDWHDPATIYPNGKPHIDLHPGQFFGGKHPMKAPKIAHYPNRLDERANCRDHHDMDQEEDMGDLWNQWWDQALTMWEGELKYVLRDELDIYGSHHGPNVPSVTVEIEWTDLD